MGLVCVRERVLYTINNFVVESPNACRILNITGSNESEVIGMDNRCFVLKHSNASMKTFDEALQECQDSYKDAGGHLAVVSPVENVLHEIFDRWKHVRVITIYRQ